MNPQQELSPDAFDQCPGPDAQDANAKQPAAIAQEILPARVSEPASAKTPTLLDRFYYWVMSRS